MHARTCLLAILTCTASACADYQTAFIEADDVRIELPGEFGFRADGTRGTRRPGGSTSGGRSPEISPQWRPDADTVGVQGDIYLLIEDTTNEVNGWVTDTVEGCSAGVEYFNKWKESYREGDLRVYGPWTDTVGRNVNWLFKVSGDLEQTSYEVWTADVSTWEPDEFQLLLAGDLVITGDELELRSGGFTIDFDVLEQHDGLKPWDVKQNSYGGTIAVTFERDTTSLHKVIELDFQEFWADYADADIYRSDDTYSYKRAADGSGTFDLSLTSTFETEAWSGPEVETMTLQSRWDVSEAGRARGLVLEENGSGDLTGGDMVIEECFDGQGTLTWREINEPYASELGDYNLGDASTCVLEW